MSETITIYCKNNNTYREVPIGSSLLEIYSLVGAPLRLRPMNAQVNNKTEGLTFRCWHRSKPMLLCFFDADDGRKIKLSVWWQSWGVNYSPSKTLINFADEVFDGSRWHCTYRKKSNGYIRWESAEQLD